MDWGTILMGYLKDLIWVLFAAVAMAMSLIILLKVYDFMTPRIDEQEELKKGNIAVAIVMGSLILAFGFVTGMVLQTGTVINNQPQKEIVIPMPRQVQPPAPPAFQNDNGPAVLPSENTPPADDKKTGL